MVLVLMANMVTYDNSYGDCNGGDSGGSICCSYHESYGVTCDDRNVGSCVIATMATMVTVMMVAMVKNSLVSYGDSYENSYGESYGDSYNGNYGELWP